MSALYTSYFNLSISSLSIFSSTLLQLVEHVFPNNLKKSALFFESRIAKTSLLVTISTFFPCRFKTIANKAIVHDFPSPVLISTSLPQSWRDLLNKN